MYYIQPLNAYWTVSSLESTSSGPVPEPILKQTEEKKPHRSRKEHKMDFLLHDYDDFVSTDISAGFIEAKQRQYLIDRIDVIREDRRTDLQIKFGLRDMRSPETSQEVVDRIKAGLYVLPEDPNTVHWGGPFSLISWRDPNVKKDRDGFDAAEKVLKSAYDTTKDLVVLGTLSEGKAAMEKFNSWTLPTN